RRVVSPHDCRVTPGGASDGSSGEGAGCEAGCGEELAGEVAWAAAEAAAGASPDARCVAYAAGDGGGVDRYVGGGDRRGVAGGDRGVNEAVVRGDGSQGCVGAE